jgi:uncharacterized membrane protein YciS (DUF1049 family)
MYMSCHGNNRKRRIAIIAGGGAVGVITYASLTANPVAAAALPVALAFAACPAMCAAIGGAMWLSRRISKGKNQAQIQQLVVNSKEEAVEVKTESIDRNQQHLTYQQKRRKDKATAQDTYAMND